MEHPMRGTQRWKCTFRFLVAALVPPAVAIGATTKGDGKVTLPIFMSVSANIRRVDFNAGSLADQVDR